MKGTNLNNLGVFAIGDVHGCLHTFLRLLEYWVPDEEILIQVGDLVDRGRHSPLVLEKAKKLSDEYPDRSIFLRGNHEQLMIDYLTGEDSPDTWFFNGGQQTMLQFEQMGKRVEEELDFLSSRPFFWENDFLYVSHAGLSGIGNPTDPKNSYGLLWNRRALLNIGKTQIIGHTPQWNGQPKFMSESKAWNIDTCAYGGICLTGIRFDAKGKFMETISIPTDERDTD